MSEKKISFNINERHCGIVLPILSFMCALTGLIVATHVMFFNYTILTDGENLVRIQFNIMWGGASALMSFMLIGALLLCIKMLICKDKQNKDNLGISFLQILTILALLVAAFSIFMHKENVEYNSIYQPATTEELINSLVNKPYLPVLITGAASTALSFFVALLNVIKYTKNNK